MSGFIAICANTTTVDSEEIDFIMHTESKPTRLFRPLSLPILQWKNLAAIAAALAVVVSVYRYMDTLHSGAIVAYLLYPAAIGSLALLVFTRSYVRYPEVRLLGAFFVWTLIVIVLNMSRVDSALSSEWFFSLCAVCFLCFSLPYAFERLEQKRVLSILALVTVLLSAVLCALAVYYVAAGRIIDARTGIEGAFGIGSDGRLWMFSHPNSAAPICGIGIVLSVYLFFTAPYRRLRFALFLPIIVCFVALSLTDSRAGILATAVALGAEAFVLLGAKCFSASRRWLRVLLAAALSVAIIVLFYQGTVWIRQGYNAFVSAGVSTGASAGASSDAQKNVAAGQAEPAASDNTQASAAPDASTTAQPKPEPQTQTVSTRDLSDFSSFNGRTAIWAATFRGLRENPSILLTGTTPLTAGATMTPYFPANAPIGNFHNSYVAILVSFGFPGLLLVLALIVLLAVRGVQLIVRGLFDPQNLHALLLLSVLVFTLAESMMEQFLFVDGMPSVVWVWFMLAAGFTFCFSRNPQEQPTA